MAALPQWELSVKVVQLLGLRGPWRRQVCRDMGCLSCRSYHLIRIFLWASCSWQSEGLFGQSFSVALPVQVLRGLPCLGSFSVVHHAHQAHRGAPLSGVLIGRSVCQALKGTPWVGFYSVDRWVSHLKGHPGWGLLCSTVRQAINGPASLLFIFPCWMWGERGHGDGSTPYVWPICIALLPWLPAFPPGAFPPHLCPHIPSVSPSTVNSSPHPGFAP